MVGQLNYAMAQERVAVLLATADKARLVAYAQPNPRRLQIRRLIGRIAPRAGVPRSSAA